MDEVDEWMLRNVPYVSKRVTVPSTWLTILYCIQRCKKPVRLVTIDEARAQYKKCNHRKCAFICRKMKTLAWQPPADAPKGWNENLDYQLSIQACITGVQREALLHLVRVNAMLVHDHSEDSLLWCIAQTR